MSKTTDVEKENYYISPKQFGVDVQSYYEVSEQVEQYTGDKESKEYKQLLRKQKKLLDVCGVYIYRMVLGLSNNGKFSGYTWKDEMIADALIQCNKALVGRKYDFSKGFNIFSYFNRVAWREFIHRIKVEKKKVDIHRQYIEEHAQDYLSDAEGQKMRIKPQFSMDDLTLYNEDVQNDEEP